MTHTNEKSPATLPSQPRYIKTIDNIVSSILRREKMMRKLCDADLAAKDCATRMARQLYTIWDVI